MCWVMPPASPAITLVLRMWSSSEVLPWSTWPITVTTGARVTTCSPLSTSAVAVSDSPYSDTNSTSKPNSSATIWRVSRSRRLLMVAIRPRRMDAAITSWGRTSIRFASSPTVMNSVARMTLADSVAISPPFSS